MATVTGNLSAQPVPNQQPQVFLSQASDSDAVDRNIQMMREGVAFVTREFFEAQAKINQFNAERAVRAEAHHCNMKAQRLISGSLYAGKYNRVWNVGCVVLQGFGAVFLAYGIGRLGRNVLQWKVSQGMISGSVVESLVIGASLNWMGNQLLKRRIGADCLNPGARDALVLQNNPWTVENNPETRLAYKRLNLVYLNMIKRINRHYSLDGRKQHVEARVLLPYIRSFKVREETAPYRTVEIYPHHELQLLFHDSNHSSGEIYVRGFVHTGRFVNRYL